MRNLPFQKMMPYVVVLLIFYIGFYFWTSRDSVRRMRALVDELDQTRDSIQSISNRYDSLHARYNTVYDVFSQTRSQLDSVRQSVESLIESNSRSVGEINRQLKSLLEEQESFEKLIIPPDTFRIE